jgi:hypothetical protein
MTQETFYFASGLSTTETWGLIVIAFLACCGVWFLLSQALDALNEWLNRRALRQTEERRRLNAVVHAEVRECRRIF